MGRQKLWYTGLAEYSVWLGMRQRCQNPNTRNWHRYGGRGIKVCDRWRSFRAFFDDMGERPSKKHSIDRLDNDGDYEPTNCAWALVRQQASNKADTRNITAFGKTQCINHWAQELGLAQSALTRRINAGWPAEIAMASRAVRLAYEREKIKAAQEKKRKAISTNGVVDGCWKNAKPLTVYGQTKTMADWARDAGITRSQIAWRLKRGFPAEVAILPADKVRQWLSAGAKGRIHASKPGMSQTGLYRVISFRGKTQGVSAWASEMGMDKHTLRRRLAAGMSVEKALTLPRDKRNRW